MPAPYSRQIPSQSVPGDLPLLSRAVLLAVVLLALVPAAGRAAVVPAGFTDERVVDVAAPTSVAFTPDGRILIATQGGTLKLRDAAGGMTDALRLGSRVCTNGERGLLGVAVDPQFAANRFIYVYYTFANAGGCPLRSTSGPVNRVARYSLGDDGIARAETVLVDGILSYAGNHNAGDLAFGPDGFLYVTVGDGGCNFAAPANCAGANDAARNPSTLLGKVLRIDRNGAAPEANGGGALCAASGSAPAGQRCRETFASGLRNPFRMAVDPNSASTRIFVNDVGQAAWEEVNQLQVGADYGWNLREGPCVRGSRSNCPPPPSGLTDPIFAYPHTSDCRSITGGAFVPGGAWPQDYDGNYLYADYGCGTIFRLSPSPDGWRSVPLVTGLGSSSAVHLAFGPGPRGPALYYTSYAGGGEVRRLSADAGGNGVPTARLQARPTAGALPLVVSFDGSGSSDPEGGRLTYLWDFGDGTVVSGDESRATHTYRRAGRYTATLRVRDGRGATSPPETVSIDAGNEAPQVVIRSSTGRVYEFGERVTIEADARDPEDGLLPASALAWNVLIAHDQHTHPFLQPPAGRSFTFEAPLPEDRQALAGTYLDVELIARDSRGTPTRTVYRLDPRRRLLSLRASLDRTRFAAGRLPVRLRAGDRGRPAELRLRMSAPATLRLSRERARSGRIAGRRCVAVTRANRRGRPCVRWVRVPGLYARSLPAGQMRLRFAGRLRRGERVRDGRHRLVVRAGDAYGRRSPVQRLGYRIR